MTHLSDQDRIWFCLLHWKYAHLDHVSKDFSCGVGIFLARSMLQRQPDNIFFSHYHMLEKQKIHASAAADRENSQTESWTFFCAAAFLKPFTSMLCCICCDALSTVWFLYRHLLPSLSSLQANYHLMAWTLLHQVLSRWDKWVFKRFSWAQ